MTPGENNSWRGVSREGEIPPSRDEATEEARLTEVRVMISALGGPSSNPVLDMADGAAWEGAGVGADEEPGDAVRSFFVGG